MNNITKKKITSLISTIAIGLLLASKVFGAVGYTRTPIGTNIEIFEGTEMTFELTGVFTEYIGTYPDLAGYEIELFTASGKFVSPCYYTDDVLWEVSDIPIGEYIETKLELHRNANCTNILDEISLELEISDYLFAIVPAPPFTYIPIDPSLPMDMLAFAGTIFTDLGSLITLSVGVPMGFVVIKKIIGLIRT